MQSIFLKDGNRQDIRLKFFLSDLLKDRNGDAGRAFSCVVCETKDLVRKFLTRGHVLMVTWR